VTDLLERRQARYGSPVDGTDCPARWHRTASAARRFGCVCPPAVQAYEAEKAAKRVRNGERASRATGKTITDPYAVRFLTPEQKMSAGIDPRDPWRGPECRVDELTVDFLVAGYTFAGTPPTKREYQLAVWRLAAQGWPGQRGAVWLGIGYQTETYYRINVRPMMADGRWRRRHADAVWRAWHKHGQRW
jgi:hypothetical protein